METTWTKESLISFEQQIHDLFEKGEIAAPTHLSGGNEEQLIEIFKGVKPEDYVFSHWRSHYHYLLKGGNPHKLIAELKGLPDGICGGMARSMNLLDPDINFYASAIVSGHCAIAVGVALGLKKKHQNKADRPHVWVFCGDGCEDSGHYVEAVRFSNSRDLSITFVLEDNDLSIDSTKKNRWHNYTPIDARNVLRYAYVRQWPHVGIGKHVMF